MATDSKISLAGWGSGFIGILIFSASLPATKLGVQGFSPMFLTSARAVIAAMLGGLMLVALKQVKPAREDMKAFAITSLGVVLGFPLFTAFALRYITSSHATVFMGLLPLSTAIFGVLRGGEVPKPLFWLFAVLGSATVIGFALLHGSPDSWAGGALMFTAITLCGLGYAEGARLTKRFGGWQVISWALLVAVPFMFVVMVYNWPATLSGIALSAWAGLAYVSVFSMFVGFVFWYRGLAIGGTATVGQLQLLQNFFALVLAALVLGETVTPSMFVATLMVVAFVALAKWFA